MCRRKMPPLREGCLICNAYFHPGGGLHSLGQQTIKRLILLSFDTTMKSGGVSERRIYDLYILNDVHLTVPVITGR